MSDFTSDFWSVYIGLITVVSIIACGVLLFTFSSAAVGGGQTTGHTWDEDLKEGNTPLPRWWMWLFFGCIIFAFIYLALYPGLGSYAGAYGWSSRGQYETEEQQANTQYGPIFEKYLKQDIQTVAADPEARAIGQRLFLNSCAQCHGSDAGGGRGSMVARRKRSRLRLPTAAMASCRRWAPRLVVTRRYAMLRTMCCRCRDVRMIRRVQCAARPRSTRYVLPAIRRRAPAIRRSVHQT